MAYYDYEELFAHIDSGRTYLVWDGYITLSSEYMDDCIMSVFNPRYTNN